MKLQFSDFYYGLRPALSESEIKNYCKKSRYFDQEKESVRDAKTLLLFSSDEKKSWLVRTNIRVYKLMDNRRESHPLINWAIMLSEAARTDVKVKPRGRGGFAVLNFSFKEGKDYIVDPALFQNSGTERTISEFLRIIEKR